MRVNKANRFYSEWRVLILSVEEQPKCGAIFSKIKREPLKGVHTRPRFVPFSPGRGQTVRSHVTLHAWIRILHASDLEAGVRTHEA
jgi:hypothetical protein